MGPSLLRLLAATVLATAAVSQPALAMRDGATGRAGAHAAFSKTASGVDRDFCQLRAPVDASQLAEPRRENGCIYGRSAKDITKDPNGYQDSVNQYAYGANDPINHRDPTGQMIPDCSVDWGSPLSKLKWVFGIVPKECETGAVASTIELGPGLLAKGASAVSRGAKIVEAIEETKVASQSAPGWRRLLGTVLKSEGEVARIEAQAAKVESLAAHDARLQLDAAEGAAAAAGRQSAARGIAREHRVAEMVGGQVSRRDVVVKGLGRTDIDVVGSAGEFIAVGGPSKAINLARLGRQMQILRAAADEAKVSAKAYFEVGTPEEALRIAKRHLGEGNVFLFEP